MNKRGLPERTQDSKYNRSPHSNTPVKIGYMETFNLMIGLSAEEIASYNMVNRTSPAARKREIKKLYTGDVLDFKGFEILAEYKNRAVELWNALTMFSGYETFVEDDEKETLSIDIMDYDTVQTIELNGEIVMGTPDEIMEYKKRLRIRELYLKNNIIVGEQSVVDAQCEEFVNKVLAGEIRIDNDGNVIPPKSRRVEIELKK